MLLYLGVHGNTSDRESVQVYKGTTRSPVNRSTLKGLNRDGGVQVQSLRHTLHVRTRRRVLVCSGSAAAADAVICVVADGSRRRRRTNKRVSTPFLFAIASSFRGHIEQVIESSKGVRRVA